MALIPGPGIASDPQAQPEPDRAQPFFLSLDNVKDGIEWYSMSTHE